MFAARPVQGSSRSPLLTYKLLHHPLAGLEFDGTHCPKVLPYPCNRLKVRLQVLVCQSFCHNCILLCCQVKVRQYCLECSHCLIHVCLLYQTQRKSMSIVSFAREARGCGEKGEMEGTYSLQDESRSAWICELARRTFRDLRALCRTSLGCRPTRDPGKKEGVSELNCRGPIALLAGSKGLVWVYLPSLWRQCSSCQGWSQGRSARPLPRREKSCSPGHYKRSRGDEMLCSRMTF